MSAIHQHSNFQLLRQYKFISPPTAPDPNQVLAFDIPGTKPGEMQLKWVNLGGFSPSQMPINVPSSSANLLLASPLKFASFYKAEANQPCRIRAYVSEESRVLDKDRSPFVKPDSTQGCVFDIFLNIKDTDPLMFSPLAIYAGENIYFSIDNLNTQNLSITLFYWG